MSGVILPASRGAGPLFQRDYWAVFEHCPMKPSELMAHLKAHFCELPPPSLVQFVAANGLAEGQEIDVTLTPGQHCCVRVIHEDALSLTLATLEGHPEAGRITFGAYRNASGEIILHIRSRARSASTTTLVGFFAIGEAMQTNTWTDFINRTAFSVSAQIRDAIHADTERSDQLPDDDAPLHSPTFRAVGD